jgi:F-type H+-transporting ATPase subunit epsilon
MPVRLSIVTPAAPLVADLSVDQVVAPGREGEFGVLPLHEPFLAPLRPGVVRYRTGAEEVRVAISGGFAEVTPERVTILARTAEPPARIEREEAERRLSEARARLERLGHASAPDEVQRARDALEHAEARRSLLS